MRDSRLYSSTVYENDLKVYEAELATTVDPVSRERLIRWIAATKQYLAQAKAAGM